MSFPDTALEVWALIAVNFLGFFLGVVITVISYRTYRARGRKPSLRNATIGFGCLTVGTATAPIYQMGIADAPVYASTQNVPLQILEGTLISLGFLLLFFSVYRYSSRTKRQTITVSGIDNDLFDDVE